MPNRISKSTERRDTGRDLVNIRENGCKEVRRTFETMDIKRDFDENDFPRLLEEPFHQ